MAQWEKYLQANFPWTITTNKQSCLGAMLKKSPCRKCVEICPQQAIELNRQIERDETICIHCGLCSRVCPEQVFYSEYLANNLDEQINEKLESGQTEISLACAKHRDPALAQLELGCLAGLHVEQLVTWGLNGVQKIWLDTNHCAQCEVQGKALIKETVAKTRGLLKSLQPATEIKVGKPATLEENALSVPGQETEVDRRVFFGQLKQGATQGVVSFLEKAQDLVTLKSSEPPSTKERMATQLTKEKGILPHRQGLITGLKKLRVKSLTTPGENWSWTGLQLEENCSTCKICSMFCWSGAIQREEKDGKFSLTWDGAKCNGCGYCVSVCPENALSKRASWDFSQRKLLTKETK